MKLQTDCLDEVICHRSFQTLFRKVVQRKDKEVQTKEGDREKNGKESVSCRKKCFKWQKEAKREIEEGGYRY